MKSSVWVANRTERWLGVVFLAVAGALLWLLVVSEGGWLTPLHVASSVLLVIALVLAVRFSRSGLQLSATGFRSRGDFWTRELRWSETAAVEVRGFVVGARLSDGRWLPLFLAQRIPPERDELVVALRSRLSN